MNIKANDIMFFIGGVILTGAITYFLEFQDKTNLTQIDHLMVLIPAACGFAIMVSGSIKKVMSAGFFFTAFMIYIVLQSAAFWAPWPVIFLLYVTTSIVGRSETTNKTE